ncbi:hypothetical protein L7F22_000217 [Adiantum nelumboides]|nr:hypothetical protein [Adiantum nelumboides]
MAMARSALTGGPFRSCLLSFPCLRHSTFSSSAVVISSEDYTDRAAHTKESRAEPWAQKGHNESVGRFLKEQRQLFNEFLCHLKDQGVVLDSIRKELGLQKFDSARKAWIDDTMILSEEVSLCFYDCSTPKEVAMNVVGTASSVNVENLVTKQLKENSNQESGVISKSSSLHGGVFAEEKSKHGGTIAVKEAGIKNFQHPSWPEWTAFLNHLRPFASNEKLKDDLELFEDTTILKRAIVKFAQAHEGTFRSLSQKDLLMLVQHEFPSMDEKTAAGKKKLDNHLNACNSGVNTNKVPRAKLTDVVRLLYRAVRSMPALGGALPSDLNSAIIHILQVLNSASIAQHKSSARTSENFSRAISQPTEEVNQKIDSANVDEDEFYGDVSSTVDGEASPHDRNASAEQSDSNSMTGAVSNFLDLPRFGSLKERVDARRERIARESQERKAVVSQVPVPFLTKELDTSPLKNSSVTLEGMKDKCVVPRNFEALDAIIGS